MKQGNKEKIAIVGMSAWYPGAKNLLELWENILSKRIQFRRIPEERLPLDEYYDEDPNALDKTYANRVAAIDGFEFDWIGKKIPQQVYKATDPVQWLALDTAIKMFEDANIDVDTLPKETTGVILGNTMVGDITRPKYFRARWPFVRKTLRTTAEKSGMDSSDIAKLEKNMEAVFKSVFETTTEDTMAGELSNTIAGRLSNYFNVQGGGHTVDGACSSSLLAIITASDRLLSGDLDFAIAGGVDLSLDTFELIGFSKMGALSKSEMRVYDTRGDGFIAGEGCGIVGLKRLSDAKRDGNKIYATLDGWGISSDGKSGIATPTIDGQVMALRRAYKKASVHPSELDFIEGHGTGTKVGDYIELAAIAEALDRNDKMEDSSIGVTSFKTIVGHTKAASGVGGLIKTAIALNQRILPPLTNCDIPHGLFSTKARVLYPIIEGEIKSDEYRMKAGVSSMGFGGINTHIVLSSADKPYEQFKSSLSNEALMVSNQDCEVLIFSAKSQEALKNKISNFIDSVEKASYAEIADIASFCAKEVNHDQPMRAAAIVTTPFQAANKLRAIVEVLSQKIFINTTYNDAMQEIFISSEIIEKEVAFIFPGQGSQQINAAKKLIGRFQWAKDMLEEARDVFRKNNCEDILDIMFVNLEKTTTVMEQKEKNKALQATEKAQPAIVLASVIWYEYMIRSGIVPSVVTGHSLGELTAFYSAGCFSLKEVLELAVIRGQAMSATGENAGSMASLMCNEDKAQKLISKVVNGYVTIANLNSPSQTVISGEKDAITELIALATLEQIRAVELAVSNAFHSDIVSDASIEFKEKFMATSKIKMMDKTIISSTDGNEVKGSLDLKEHFSNQIVDKVDFITTSQKLMSLSEIIIEVGPSGVLSKLVKSNNEDAIVYPCASNPNSFKDINTVFAMLFVNGHELNWKNIYSNRLIRNFIPSSEMTFLTNPCEYEFSEVSINSIEKLTFSTNTSENDEIDEHIDISNENLKESSKVTTLKQVSTDQHLTQTPNASTLELLLTIASKMTGFPFDSLDGSMHLLDDLNFDSIKAGELIASATMQLKITAEIDPMALSGLSISGIADYFDSLKAKRTNTTTETEAKCEKLMEQASEGVDDRWVREFILKNVPSEIDSELYEVNKESMQKTFPDTVEILYDEISIQLAETIQNKLSKYGVDSLLNNYSNYSKESKDVIAILSKPNAELAFEESSLTNALEYLSIPLAVPLRSVSYIQFDSPIFHHGNIANIQSGCANAYIASAHFEQKNTRMRVIDSHTGLDEEILSEALLQEQLLADKYIFSSYNVEGMRYITQPDLYEVQLEKKREYQLGKEDVILVTGGAKGITAECALALAKETNAKMALVGSSSLTTNTDKDSEINRTLQRFKDNDIVHAYYSCDISKSIEVEKLIKVIENDLGKITCIVHGAGINNFVRASGLDVQRATKDCGPKLSGILNLCKYTDSNKLKLIVGLSSVIGMTGMPGNSVYGFSNEALNTILQNYEKINPQTNIISIAYSVWDEVGMGAKMGSTKSLEKMGIYAIPIKKGVEHFLRLIRHQSQDPFVAVSAKLGGLDTWKEKVYRRPKADRFIQDIIELNHKIDMISKVTLSLETDKYLVDHKYRNAYLMPTVFGLEAMGQAVATVMGLSDFSGGLSVENIELTKPIIVREGIEQIIYVKAVVQENYDTETPWKVNVYISTDFDNFSEAEFQATFILETPKVEYDESFTMPDSKLDIQPKVELYNYQLFQGKMFQRIQEIYSMSTNDVFCSIDFSKAKDTYSEEFSNEMILGNPCSRDAMLQTAQLTDSKMFLPIKISRLNIYSTALDGEQPTKTIVKNRFDTEIEHNVIVFDNEGKVLEKLDGYKSKQVGKNKAFVEPEDFAAPRVSDKKIFNEVYRDIQQAFSLEYPEVIFDYEESLSNGNKDYKHQIEQNILSRASELGEIKNIENPVLNWEVSGKPLLDKKCISISHSQAHILFCVGDTVQGCDIEAVKARSKDEWARLLGTYDDLIDQLLQSGDSLDQAGTRIWSVKEAYLKQFGELVEKITISSNKKQGILFEALTKKNSSFIMTFPIQLTRNTEKMIALAVETEGTKKYNSDVLNVYEEGNSFHKVFSVSFKESTLLQKLVDYPIIASWMGKLRESALLEIGEKIIADSTSGKYAWVTNYSNMNIYRAVASFDKIEGKVWTSQRFGTKNSSNILHFELNKIGNDGSIDRIAYAEMSTTWVVIKEHGVVEAAPYPDYLDLFMTKIENSEFTKQAMKQLVHNELHQKINLKLSDNILYKAKNEPIIKPLIHTEIIQTSLKEANLIGNVYFSHYYEWQKLCIDNYIHSIYPDFYKGLGENGELFAVHSEVTHLREAMPFYTVKVTMHLKVLHDNGIELDFNYYGVSGENEDWVKLANGNCHVVWAKKENTDLVGLNLPDPIMKLIEKNCTETAI